MIETLAEARDNGWQITARCGLGVRRNLRINSAYQRNHAAIPTFDERRR
jgi:hypothetical protein